jgi:hypothetical protein
MATEDFSGLSDEEFMDEWTAFGEKVAADHERLLEYSAEFQRRERKRQLAERMSDMSESDLALLQEVRVEGIESAEAVGAQEEGADA